MTVKWYFQSHYFDYCPGHGMSTPPVPNITLAPSNRTSLPVGPKNLTAAAVSRTQVNLSWTAVPRATQYRIKRTSTNGAPHVFLASTTAATFADTTISGAGASYYYVVIHVNGSGVESRSSSLPNTTAAWLSSST